MTVIFLDFVGISPSEYDIFVHRNCWVHDTTSCGRQCNFLRTSAKSLIVHSNERARISQRKAPRGRCGGGGAPTHHLIMHETRKMRQDKGGNFLNRRMSIMIIILSSSGFVNIWTLNRTFERQGFRNDESSFRKVLDPNVYVPVDIFMEFPVVYHCTTCKQICWIKYLNLLIYKYHNSR